MLKEFDTDSTNQNTTSKCKTHIWHRRSSLYRANVTNIDYLILLMPCGPHRPFQSLYFFAKPGRCILFFKTRALYFVFQNHFLSTGVGIYKPGARPTTSRASFPSEPSENPPRPHETDSSNNMSRILLLNAHELDIIYTVKRTLLV